MSTYHEEEFNLILNTKKYLINISILENQLSLVLTLLTYPPQQYSGFFSLEDLRICGKIFQHAHSLFEAKEIIKRTVIKKQLLINEDSHRAKITFDPGLDLDSVPFFMTLFRDLNMNNSSLSQTVENINKSYAFKNLNYTPKTEPIINFNDSSNFYDYFNINNSNYNATPSVKNIINDETINYNIRNNYMIHNNEINRNKFMTFLPKFKYENNSNSINNLIFNNRRTNKLPKKIKRYSSYNIINHNLFQKNNLNYLNYSMNNENSYTNINNNDDTNSNLNYKESLYSHFYDSMNNNNIFKNNSYINRTNDDISFVSNDLINNRIHHFNQTQNSEFEDSLNSLYNNNSQTIENIKQKRNDIINNLIYKRNSKTIGNNKNNFLYNQRNLTSSTNKNNTNTDIKKDHKEDNIKDNINQYEEDVVPIKKSANFNSISLNRKNNKVSHTPQVKIIKKDQEDQDKEYNTRIPKIDSMRTFNLNCLHLSKNSTVPASKSQKSLFIKFKPNKNGQKIENTNINKNKKVNEKGKRFKNVSKNIRKNENIRKKNINNNNNNSNSIKKDKVQKKKIQILDKKENNDELDEKINKTKNKIGIFYQFKSLTMKEIGKKKSQRSCKEFVPYEAELFSIIKNRVSRPRPKMLKSNIAKKNLSKSKIQKNKIIKNNNPQIKTNIHHKISKPIAKKSNSKRNSSPKDSIKSPNNPIQITEKKIVSKGEITNVEEQISISNSKKNREKANALQNTISNVEIGDVTMGKEKIKEVLPNIISKVPQNNISNIEKNNINISKEPETNLLKLNSNKESEVTSVAVGKEIPDDSKNTISSAQKDNKIIEKEKVEAPINIISKNEEKIIDKEKPIDTQKVMSNTKNDNNTTIIGKEVAKVSLNTIPNIEKNDNTINKEKINEPQNIISSNTKKDDELIDKESLRVPQNKISNIQKDDIKEKIKVSQNNISKPKNEEKNIIVKNNSPHKTILKKEKEYITNIKERVKVLQNTISKPKKEENIIHKEDSKAQKNTISNIEKEEINILKEKVKVLENIISKPKNKENIIDKGISEVQYNSISSKEKDNISVSKEREKISENTISKPKNKENNIIGKEDSKVQNNTISNIEKNNINIGKDTKKFSQNSDSKLKNEENNIIDKEEVQQDTISNIEKDDNLNKEKIIVSHNSDSKAKIEDNNFIDKEGLKVQQNNAFIPIAKDKEKEKVTLNTASKPKNEENKIYNEGSKVQHNTISSNEKGDINIAKERIKVLQNIVSKPKNDENMVYKENPKVEFNLFSNIERDENSIIKEKVKATLNTASKPRNDENINNIEGSKIQQKIEKDDINIVQERVKALQNNAPKPKKEYNMIYKENPIVAFNSFSENLISKEKVSQNIISKPRNKENIIYKEGPKIQQNSFSTIERNDNNDIKIRVKVLQKSIFNKNNNTIFGNRFKQNNTALTTKNSYSKISKQNIKTSQSTISKPKYEENIIYNESSRIPLNTISKIERNDISYDINKERARVPINIISNSERNDITKIRQKTRDSMNTISRIKDLDKINYKLRKILNKNKIEFKLIYKGSIDGDSSIKFHEKCNNYKNTLVLIYSSINKKFGGFTTRTWEGEDINKADDHCFIFSVEKGIIYDFDEGEDAIKCSEEYGPIFVNQIAIFDNFITQGGIITNIAKSFNMKEDDELLDAYEKFGVKDVEVYHVIS